MENKTYELLEQLKDNSIDFDSISIRENGKTTYRKIVDGISYTDKPNSSGFIMNIKKGTKDKCVHIPVVITQDNLNETVYNDFLIQDDSEVIIIAGCGIHNNAHEMVSHNGIHSFKIGKNCKIKYIEKHLGLGDNLNKVLNPTTKIVLGENSKFDMETFQIKGVSFADRKTYASLKDGASLIINEKIMTSTTEVAKTFFKVNLKGKNSSVEVVSRAVAKDKSRQTFSSNLIGENKCFGHVECDGIISENAKMVSIPKIEALHVDAMLIHEAAIGKISEEQTLKLMTLGLNQDEAEKKIIEGFLK